MTEEPLEQKPLTHLDKLFPAVAFMEITDKRDGSKSVVGVRSSIRETVFVELPRGEREEVEVAYEIDARLHKKVIQSNTRSDGGVITGYEPGLMQGQMNREQLREMEIHTPRREARVRERKRTTEAQKLQETTGEHTKRRRVSRTLPLVPRLTKA